MIATSIRDKNEDTEQTDVRQVLTFMLNGQDYGLELIGVQEIRGFTAITPIPNMPPHIKGVMNLRGSVLPVVDLRLKFGMPAAEYTKFTVIMIAHSAGKSVGLIIDSISDVVMASNENIQATPDFGSAFDTRFVSGLLKSNERLAILLDLDRLLTEEEVTGTVSAAESGETSTPESAAK
jgi:purine-binding chemotaxis protein CheW